MALQDQTDPLAPSGFQFWHSLAILALLAILSIYRMLKP